MILDEALIRLCQARAKACLRDFVLREDAIDVVELMSKSVDQVHSDDHGEIARGAHKRCVIRKDRFARHLAARQKSSGK